MHGHIMANMKNDILDDQVENFRYTTSLIKIVIFIVAVFIFVFSRYAFIFFSAAVFPSIAVIFLDKAGHKCASATICTFNLIGITPYLKRLWNTQTVNDAAKDIIMDPIACVIIFSTTFVGFFIYTSLPPLIAKIYVAKANVKIDSLIAQRNKICSEWDIKLEEREKEDDEFKL